MNTRQYYIDWIRVTAFMILILFHTGMFFVSWGWHVKNNVIIPQIEPFMLFFNQWRLPLLFFISGVGVSFALKSRTAKEFIIERNRRLLIPLIFGMFVIVPPQIYFERLQTELFNGSYLDFYPQVLEFQPYPAGSFSWHHLWFLPYLFSYCLVCMPLFIWLKKQSGIQFLSRLSDLTIRPFTIFVYAIPFIFSYLILAPRFEITHNFVVDWYNHAFSICLFAFGYIIGSQINTWNMLEIHRKKYLIITILLVTILYLFFWIPVIDYQSDSFWRHIAYSILKMLFIWSIILTICGYFKHYLNKSNAFIKYATEAVLPFYILHQTITVSVGYYLSNLQLPVIIKFIVLVLVTFLGSWMIYHYIVRPFNMFRFLFGLKSIKSEIYGRFILKPVITSIVAIIIISLTFNFFIWAKEEPIIVQVPDIEIAPKIDGILDDQVWNKSLKYNDFKTLNPRPGLHPSEPTEFFLAYDHENMYVGINCFDSQPDKISVEETGEEKLGDEDWVAFCLDTYTGNEGIFFFAVNPIGTRIDGTLDFLEANPNPARNLQWASSVKKTKNGWSAEMAIPFKHLPFSWKENVQMRFKVARNISRLNEEVEYPEIYPNAIPRVAQFKKISFSGIENN